MAQGTRVCLLFAGLLTACNGGSPSGPRPSQAGDAGVSDVGSALPPETRWAPCQIAGAALTQLAYSRDGRWLGIARADGRVLAVRLGGGASRSFQIEGGAPLIALSEDGGMLATAVGGSIRLWSVADGTMMRTLSVGEGPGVALQFSDAPDPLLLATVDEGRLSGGNIRVWRARDGVPVATLTGKAQATFTYADMAVLVIDETAGRFDVLSWQGERLRQVAFPRPLRHVAFAPDGAYVAGVLDAGSADERIGLLSVGDDIFAWTSMVPTRSSRRLVFLENPSRILQLADSARIYDHASGLVLLEPETLRDALLATASPDGSELAALTAGGKVILVSTADGAARPAPVSFFGVPGPIRDVRVAGDGRTVALMGEALVQVVDLEGPRLLQSLETPVPSAVALSPDGALLAIATAAEAVVIQVKDASRTVTLPARGGTCTPAVAFSPDGTVLARAGCGEIQLLGLDGSLRTKLVSRRTNPAVAFSPDGMRLATSAPELFDLTTGELVWSGALGALSSTDPEPGPTGDRIVFSRDGQRMLVSQSTLKGSDPTGEGVVESWLLETARGQVVRALGATFGHRPSLSPDGHWIAGSPGVLHTDAEAPLALPQTPEAAFFLPDGRLLGTRPGPLAQVYCPL